MEIRIENLVKSYGDKKALDDITLSLEKGRVIGLLGKNGAGKSTLIKTINRLVQPDSGTVSVGNLPEEEIHKSISYLPDNFHLNLGMKVEDAIRLFQDFYPDFDTQKAERLLEQLEIDPKKKIRALSKGMKEKLQLALILSRKADFYIFDEPLAGVDPASRDQILNMILDNLDGNPGVLISTHLVADIERILDEVIFLDQGKIDLQMDADELRDKYKQSIDEYFRVRYA